LTRGLAALPPGSFPWLLRHELRLPFRDKANRMSAPLLGVVCALLHLVGLMAAFGLTHLSALPRSTVLVSLSLMLFSTLLFMLSTTLVAATQALYERGDMDLLLSSPLSRRVILWGRATAMAVGQIAASGFLILPIANGFILFGYWDALAAYVWLPALALLATGLGIALTLGLFRLIGPRRTRLVAQIIGAVIGICFALVFQGPNLLSGTQKRELFQGLASSGGAMEGLIWLPGRAAMGEIGPLLLLLAIGGGLFALVAWGLAHYFTGATIATAGATAVRSRPAKRTRGFRGGTVALLRTKELRLLARDPWLLTQVAQQVVGILPVGFVLFRHDIGYGTLAWLVVVAAAGLFSGGFVWLAVVGEEMPDLLAAAPLSPRTMLWAKLQAAYFPVACLVLPAAAIAALGSGGPWLGLTLAACSIGAGLSVGMLDLHYAQPARRGDFRLRHKGRMVLGLGEMLLAIGWVGVAALMLDRSIWAVVLGLALLAPVPGGLLKFARTDRATGTATPRRSFE